MSIPFNLEAAKAGKPIQTRDGLPVKLLSHRPDLPESHRVIAFVNESRVMSCSEDGVEFIGSVGRNDLFMVDETLAKTGGKEGAQP